VCARSLALAAAGLIVGVGLLAAWHPARADDDADVAQVQQRIDQLIEQLGAEQFAVRERAQRQLLAIGLDAFDALYRAQEHGDIEIKSRARYLVRSVRVGWVLPDDSPEVRAVLTGYADSGWGARETIIGRLRSLDDDQGVPALCRIARFDTSEVLSKRAAQSIIEMTAPEQVELRARRQRLLREALGVSRRTSAGWLRVYAEWLTAPQSAMEPLAELVHAEADALANLPGKTDADIVCSLVRWQADALLQIDRRDEALTAMRQMLQLQPTTIERLSGTIDWLVLRDAWEMIDELAKRYPEQFRDHPELLYRLAAARLSQDDPQAAEELAAQAFAAPGAGDDDREVVTRINVGRYLVENGLFDWAEREYRLVIDLTEEDALRNVFTRSMLATMLHDRQRNLQAAEVLKPGVERIAENRELKQMVQRVGRDVGNYEARMHFYYAMHHAEQGNRAKQIEHLQQACEADATDLDLLIAMYRLPEPTPAWREKTLDLIQQTAQKCEREAEQYRQMARKDPDEPALADMVAQSCNHYAWLVANTEGDYPKALKMSLESNRLMPDSASLLDTLGRCYFAVDDLDSAVKHQRRAAELDPHNGAIARQLKQFEDARKQSQSEPNAAPPLPQ